jgi:hypothetical protein
MGCILIRCVFMSDPHEEQLVGLAIDNYLTKTEKITKEERGKMNKIVEHYATCNEHATVVSQLFAGLKKGLRKENFSPTCKRFLILLDDILEQSKLKPHYQSYARLISQQLVDCFVFVFSLIFQYEMHEASLDWKVYRMLWAKTIPDSTFDQLRYSLLTQTRNHRQISIRSQPWLQPGHHRTHQEAIHSQGLHRGRNQALHGGQQGRTQKISKNLTPTIEGKCQ